MKKLILIAALVLIGVMSMPGCVAVTQGVEGQQNGLWVSISNATIFNLFAVGSFGFWIFIVVWALILSCFASDDDDYWKLYFGAIVVGLLAMWVFSAFNPFALLFFCAIANWQFAVAVLLGYPFLGIVYACAKIKLKSIDLAKEHVIEKRNFFAERRIDSKGNRRSDAELEVMWHESPRSAKFTDPEISHYKSSVIFWMSAWPFSGIHTILSDYVIRLFDTLYKHLENIFNKILRSSLKNIIAEAELAKKAKAPAEELAREKTADYTP